MFGLKINPIPTRQNRHAMHPIAFTYRVISFPQKLYSNGKAKNPKNANMQTNWKLCGYSSTSPLHWTGSADCRHVLTNWRAFRATDAAAAAAAVEHFELPKYFYWMLLYELWLLLPLLHKSVRSWKSQHKPKNVICIMCIYFSRSLSLTLRRPMYLAGMKNNNNNK